MSDEQLANEVLSVMSTLIDAGLGREARFVHRLWKEIEGLQQIAEDWESRYNEVIGEIGGTLP
jgi:hypothetical protein